MEIPCPTKTIPHPSLCRGVNHKKPREKSGQDVRSQVSSFISSFAAVPSSEARAAEPARSVVVLGDCHTCSSPPEMKVAAVLSLGSFLFFKTHSSCSWLHMKTRHQLHTGSSRPRRAWCFTRSDGSKKRFVSLFLSFVFESRFRNSVRRVASTGRGGGYDLPYSHFMFV